jgi:hypothetical protein
MRPQQQQQQQIQGNTTQPPQLQHALIQHAQTFETQKNVNAVGVSGDVVTASNYVTPSPFGGEAASIPSAPAVHHQPVISHALLAGSTAVPAATGAAGAAGAVNVTGPETVNIAASSQRSNDL